MKRCVLITNLGGVNIGPVRTWAHALLLVENSDGHGPRFVARGFGVEAGFELFTMSIPSLLYSFTPEPPPKWATDMGAKLLSTHGTLRIRREDRDEYHTDTVEMTLDCNSLDGREIHFESIEKPDVMRLWRVLHARVVHYWHAPYMVVGRQIPIGLAREVTAGDAR